MMRAHRTGRLHRRCSAEIGTGSLPNRRNGVYHCPISADRQVKARAIERHQLGTEFGNPVHEIDNQFLFRPFSYVGCAQGRHFPMGILTTSHQSADANDGMDKYALETCPPWLREFRASALPS